MERHEGQEISGSGRDVAEVCEGWWLREEGKVHDDEIVKILE